MNYADLDLNQLYSYADYFKWQFTERAEMIKGKILKKELAPTYFHQNITGNIFYYFRRYLEN